MGHTTDLLAECASSLGNLTSASGGLTSALEHITTVARKIEQRFRELEEKEDYLKKLSEMVVSKQQELLGLEVELREKNSSLVQRNQEVIMKEERWSETEKKMAENAAKMNNKIQLNVGGQKFATSKITLLEFKGSFFEALILSEHTQNADAGFFIDRDPKYFPIVLNYMRDGKFRNSDIKSIDIAELMDEFAFFKIPFPHNQINLNANVSTYSTPTTSTQTTQQSAYESSPAQSTQEQPTPASPASPASPAQWSCAPDTTTQTPPAQQTPAQQADAKKKEKSKFEGGGDLLSVALRDQIKQWIPERRFTLLYKASRDGFGFKDFHTRCDNKGPMLTIIQAKEGFLFGGFTPDSFDSSGEFRNFPTAFIFTLTNPHNIPPTRYNLKRGNTAAIRCLANSGPVFGDGDIRVENNADSEPSFIYFPASYFDTTNQRKLTFTGTRKFFTKDLEVYSVI